MKINQIKFYGGAREKICRLGLSHLFLELQEIIFKTYVAVQKKKHGNSAAVVRERIDASFEAGDSWIKSQTGDIDWIKRIRYNESILSRLGVEIQVSGRSDMLSRDIVHIRNNLQDSVIDIGVIVVPSDDFRYCLTDRVADFSYAKKYVEEELREAKAYPIILMSIEHDEFADVPLPKKKTNRGIQK